VRHNQLSLAANLKPLGRQGSSGRLKKKATVAATILVLAAGWFAAWKPKGPPIRTDLSPRDTQEVLKAVYHDRWGFLAFCARKGFCGRFQLIYGRS
jgi:hypothetical protein